MVSEDSLAHRANRLLVCDTDVVTTTCWANTFFGSCPAWLEKEAQTRRYARTFLLSPDGARHLQDGTRVMTDNTARLKFFDSLCAALDRAGRHFTVVSGDWQERHAQCVSGITAILAQK
jgi:nicotinamide riboside kinase